MRQRRYQLFMDRANGGSLLDLIDVYEKNELYFPEAFVWDVFRNLIKACVILEQGSLDEPVEGWAPIYHFDISPANILLHTPAGRTWPNALLTDFGMVFQSLHPSDNPHEWVGVSSEMYSAPEQTMYYYLRDPVTRASRTASTKITSKTNLWGVGAIMWKMIVQDPEFALVPDRAKQDVSRNVEQMPGPKYDDFLCLQPPSLGHDVWFPARNRMNAMRLQRGENILTRAVYQGVENYSDDLLNVVRACLRHEPDDRAELADVRDVIYAWFNANPLPPDAELPGVLPISVCEKHKSKVSTVFEGLVEPWNAVLESK